LLLSFRHLGFSTIHNFNGRSAVWGQYASRYRISSKSVKRAQSYGDLTDFQNGGRRHLGFVKFKLTVGAVKRSILHNRAKFRKDRSNRCGDIAIFVIFQDGGRRHLGFQKFEILTVFPV